MARYAISLRHNTTCDWAVNTCIRELEDDRANISENCEGERQPNPDRRFRNIGSEDKDPSGASVRARLLHIATF